MANMHLVTGYAGQAHVTAADQASLYASLFGADSFILNRGNKLAASIVTNNSISVADGDAIMQGRHIRLNEGETVNLTIDNGETGMYRNDLIVLRYTKNVSTGIEEANLVVIKGTAVDSNPTDPEYTTGSIITDHALQADMPLYRVPLNGLNVQPLVQLCSVFGTIKEQVSKAEKSAASAQSTADKAEKSAASAQSTADKGVSDAASALEEAKKRVLKINGASPDSSGNISVTPSGIGAAPQSHNQASSTITTGGSEGQILAVNANGTISPSTKTIAKLGTGANYSLSGTTLTITTV